MNDDLLKVLLNEGENVALDYKQEQYRFVGEDDETKSELLKDILAFANSSRRSDAYILIGFEEVPGGPNVLRVSPTIWPKIISNNL